MPNEEAYTPIVGQEEDEAATEEPVVQPESAEQQPATRSQWGLKSPSVITAGLMLTILLALLAWVSAAKGNNARNGDSWVYGEIYGPLEWGGLCEKGKSQSPIDIPEAAAGVQADAPPMQLTWSDPGFTVDATVVDSGHGTMQANFPPGSGNLTTADGAVYGLAQVHCHAPSEHTRGGRSSVAECHFVHVADDGALAVLGVFLGAQPGVTNPAMEMLLDKAPPKDADSSASDSDSDSDTDDSDDGDDGGVPAPGFPLGAFLPPGNSLAAYSGSLTTPPCTEGVSWFVLLNDLPVGADQILRFMEYVAGEGGLALNDRPTQELHGREVTFYSEA
ncbi:unnamed protein product [Pedinophyceae sp. YPF-701]|nr:unnamed protein product [Pedinophyceae sp. YPF-701]